MILRKTTYKFVLIPSLAIFILTATNLNAVGNSFPGVEVPKKESSLKCYIYGKYAVVLSEVEQAIGEIITVYSWPSENDTNCHAMSEKSIVFIVDGSGSTETFCGIYRYFLFTDSGTGPDGHGIGIYDLIKKKQVYYAIYSGSDMKIENNKFVFVKDIKPKQKIQCAGAEKWKSQGLDFGFEQKTLIDLDSLREVAVGEITCSPRQ